MNAVTAGAPETLIDVRPMPPRERHPTIFSTWEGLVEGGSILLINDHDPLPLYYQFAAEWPGGFHWEYLDQGPEVWRVRIRRGRFADPGFRPDPGARGSCRPRVEPIRFVEPSVLDVGPLLAAGQTPCGAIDQAVSRLIPGQPLVVLVPFEPVPLYAKMANCGFDHAASQLPDGTWRVEFRPGTNADAGRFEVCGPHDHGA
jgi:uncharacterized protein (DUF2249 family)